MKTYHLSPAEPGWKLTLEGFDDPVETYPEHTKAEALAQAIEVVASSSTPASLRIHRIDGTFEEERTYPRAADPIATVG